MDSLAIYDVVWWVQISEGERKRHARTVVSETAGQAASFVATQLCEAGLKPVRLDSCTIHTNVRN